MKTSDIPTIDVLLACIEFHKMLPHNSRMGFHGVPPWRILMHKFNAPEKVVYSAMERDHRNGYLEYGVTLRTAWVTAKGFEYLKSQGVP